VLLLETSVLGLPLSFALGPQLKLRLYLILLVFDVRESLLV
jgi:hypothetical protein